MHLIDACAQCVFNENLPKVVRAEFASLMLVLYVDTRPYGKFPVGEQTHLWESLGDGSSTPAVAVFRAPEDAVWFKGLTYKLVRHLDEQNGVMIAALHDDNRLTYSILQLLWRLLQFGIIIDAADQKHLARTIILLLDGRCVRL